MGTAGTNDTERRPLDALPAITNFLNRQRIQDARRRNKTKLCPEGNQALRALRDKLNNSGPVAPKDADATKSNIYNIKVKWIRYGN